jgi:two-component system LytT family response regulator
VAGALLAGLSVNGILHTLLWLLAVHEVAALEVPGLVVRDALDHAHLNAVVYGVVIAVAWWVDRTRVLTPAASAASLAGITNGSRYATRLTARRRDTLTVVAVDDVDWIEGADDYACLHVGARRHLTDDRLRELERILDPARFVRVHRSALVNLARVREVEDGRWGDAVAVLRDGTRVRVSRTRREALMSALRPRDEG